MLLNSSSLMQFSIITPYWRFSTGLAQTRKQCSNQNLFFLHNKGLNNPIQVAWHAKKQFKVVTNCNTAQQKSFPKLNFTNFVIKQPANSRKLGCVNSIILNNIVSTPQKSGPWQGLNFERRLLEKRGVIFFRGVTILQKTN